MIFLVIISYITISAFLPSYVLNLAKFINSCSHTVWRVFWHEIFAFLAKLGKILLNLSILSKLWQNCLHRSTHFLQEYLVWQFCLHGQNSAKSGKIRLNLSRLSKWWQKCLHRSKHKLVWQFGLHDQNTAKIGKTCPDYI